MTELYLAQKLRLVKLEDILIGLVIFVKQRPTVVSFIKKNV